MASVNFRVRGKSQMNSIYIRFKINEKEDFEISTGIRVPSKKWSTAKQQVLLTGKIDYQATNEKLKELSAFVAKEYHLSTLDEMIINSQWLKEKVNFILNRQTNNKQNDSSKYLRNFVELYIEESRSRKTKKNTEVKVRTIQHYQTTLNKIIAFEEFKNKKLILLDIDLKFHLDFVNYLEKTHCLNPNTVGGYIDDIKLFCTNADRRGYSIKKDYLLQEFYSPFNKTNDIYFDEETVTKIFEHKTEKDYLDNAKDWFVIGLRTGFRISDFLQLKPENICNGFIEKNTIKTETPVIIPIHPEVQIILNKRNGDFPRKISDQKFNNYIKEICEEMGMHEKVDGAKLVPIKVKDNNVETLIHRKVAGKYKKYELVSSHICRRSFATNLYGKIDTLTIMKITGHSTEKQFLGYIKTTPKQYAERLKEFWMNGR